MARAIDYSKKQGAYPKVSAADIGASANRVLPRQVSTGSTRGTQTVGFGGTKIDGSNNVITVGDSILLDGGTGVITVQNDDGSQLGMGLIPDNSGQSGFFSLDTNGNLVMKIVNGTMYVYNPADNFVNVTQSGLLPDGSGGFVVAAEGYNVRELY